MNRFFCLLDTKKSRDVRTIINLTTNPLLHQFEAQGHDMSEQKKILEEEGRSQYHWGKKVWIQQQLLKASDFGPKGYKISFAWDIETGTYERGNFFEKQYIEENPIEISEQSFQDNYINNLFPTWKDRGIEFKRHTFLISDRHKKIQPKVHGNKNLYDVSPINWRIVQVKTRLIDQIFFNTCSRSCIFSLCFPHDYKKCSGAFVRQSDENKRDFLYQVQDI